LLQQEFSLATELVCGDVVTATHEQLLLRLQGLDRPVRKRLLQTYAAPLLQKMAAVSTSEPQSGSIE
jgi:hypothetical protein